MIEMINGVAFLPDRVIKTDTFCHNEKDRAIACHENRWI